MIRPLNIRGCVAPDPLDNLPPRARLALASGVTFSVSAAFLYVIFYVLSIATLHPRWLFLVECAAMALLYAPVVLYLRKSSSLVLIGLLAAALIPVDIAIESHVRAAGKVAPWMYSAEGLLGGVQPLLRIVIVWVVDGLIMGPFALWLCRLLASLSKRQTQPGSTSATPEQAAALFPDEWSREAQPRVPPDVSFVVLRGVGLAYLSYASLLLVGLVGTAAWPASVRPLLEMTYTNPALTINTFIKISFVVSLAFLGAYNRELRFHTGLILFGAHVISTGASLLFWLVAPSDDPQRPFLLLSSIADAVMAGFLAWVVAHHRALAERYALPRDFPEFFSVPQRLARVFWRSFAVVCALIPPAVLGIRFLLDPASSWGAVYGYPDPQISNTITKYATMSLIGFMICRREALREKLLVPLVNGFTISFVASALWLLLGDLTSDVRVHTRTGGLANVDWYFALNVVTDTSLAGLILWLRRTYYDVDHGIVALSPSSAQHVMGLHEVLFEPGTGDPSQTPTLSAQVVQAIDRHVGSIRGRKRGLLNLPFWLLENVAVVAFGLRPPFSMMDTRQRQAWLRRYVLRPPMERRRAFVPLLAEAMYRLGTAAHAFINWAHFDQLGGQGAVRYVPPGARPRLQGRYASGAPPAPAAAPLPRGPADPENFAPGDRQDAPPLVAPRLVTPCEETSLPSEVDYLIVGSGAGGAVMAYRLASGAARPGRILVVERGPRLSPPRDFDDGEMSMIRQLYKEGGLQQTRRFGLTILQGECVGGSTVINNGICAKIPDGIRQIWQEQYGAPLDGLDAEYDAVAREIGIGPIDPFGVNQLVRRKFDESVRPLAASGELKPIELFSNHRNLLGTGLDNLGDRHMRKRSMLETYLPWAEGRGVQIASEITAVRFSGKTSRRADEVILRTSLGTLKRVRVNKAVIVSGGVIASSHFLMRSDVGGGVGRNVSCNFALPAVAEFREALHAYDGLQITLGALDVQNRAIFESYFSAPAAFAISVPFFFERHRELMQAYVHHMNFGALVGSQPGGTVERKADILAGRAISWRLQPADVDHLKFALRTLVSLAHSGGARRVVLRTEPGISLEPTRENCERFAKALDAYPLSLSDLALVTAHPQGGNRMAARGSPQANTAVVDERFRLSDWDNVYVADASLFPTGITVNPQWTIMALASLAARCVLSDHESVQHAFATASRAAE